MPNYFVSMETPPFADVDLNASGLLPLLVEEIANDHSRDDQCTDDEVENVTIHSLVASLKSQGSLR